jgi:ribosome-associated protein
MDYDNVMVHIFNREQRDFFKLEKLWADAEDVSIEDLVTD